MIKLGKCAQQRCKLFLILECIPCKFPHFALAALSKACLGFLCQNWSLALLFINLLPLSGNLGEAYFPLTFYTKSISGISCHVYLLDETSGWNHEWSCGIFSSNHRIYLLIFSIGCAGQYWGYISGRRCQVWLAWIQCQVLHILHAGRINHQLCWLPLWNASSL